MVVLRLAMGLLIVAGTIVAGTVTARPGLACGPDDFRPDPLGDVNDVFDAPKLRSVGAPPPADALEEISLDDDDVMELPSLTDIDDLLEPAPDISRPIEPSWRLPVRDALAFKTWPPDLDQGNAVHRQAMDLVERSIIPLERGSFRPDARVTRIQLLDWLAQVEDWVRVGQTGLSLEIHLTMAKRSCPMVTLLRLGLVVPNHPLEGDAWVDRAFELKVLDALERTWGTTLLVGRPRLTAHAEANRAEIAVWLREIAQDLCHQGHAPVGRVEAKSLAHLTVLLTLLEDPSPTVREMAHRLLADADAAIVATLLAGRKEEWFRDPVVLETLPETAVKLALAPSDVAAGQFREVMRILRGLKDQGLETRFVRAAQDALRQLPLSAPLPPRLLSEMVGVLAARGWTEQLDNLLAWGYPALEAMVPYLENESLDPRWAERMPYSIEPGWDQRGLGVVAQLKLLVKNPRIPAGTRASALDRLDRLGEAIPREQMRSMGQTPDSSPDRDPDAARARLARLALRLMDKNPPAPAPRPRPLAEDPEVVRLVSMVRSYQLYLAIALGVIALITLAHLLVIIPLLMLRIIRKIRASMGVHGPTDGCGR